MTILWKGLLHTRKDVQDSYLIWCFVNDRSCHSDCKSFFQRNLKLIFYDLCDPCLITLGQALSHVLSFYMAIINLFSGTDINTSRGPSVARTKCREFEVVDGMVWFTCHILTCALMDCQLSMFKQMWTPQLAMDICQNKSYRSHMSTIEVMKLILYGSNI